MVVDDGVYCVEVVGLVLCVDVVGEGLWFGC